MSHYCAVFLSLSVSHYRTVSLSLALSFYLFLSLYPFLSIFLHLVVFLPHSLLLYFLISLSLFPSRLLSPCFVQYLFIPRSLSIVRSPFPLSLVLSQCLTRYPTLYLHGSLSDPSIYYALTLSVSLFLTRFSLTVVFLLARSFSLPLPPSLSVDLPFDFSLSF